MSSNSSSLAKYIITGYNNHVKQLLEISQQQTRLNNTLNGAAGRSALPVPSLAEGGNIMSTYEEFMVLLTFAILIVTILEYVNHKK